MTLSLRARMLLVLTTVTMLFLGGGMTLASPTPADDATYRITAIQPEQAADTFLLRIQGDAAPTYTMYELFNPLRIVIDIADAALADTVHLPLQVDQGPVASIKGQMLDDQHPSVTRIEVLLSEDRGYAVERSNNDIVVKFAERTTTANDQAALPPPASQRDGEQEGAQPAATVLQGIRLETLPGKTCVFLQANGPIRDFQKEKLAKGTERPDRLYIDIPEIGLGDVPQQIKVGTALHRIRTARRGSGVRIVFDSGLSDMFDYQINSREDGLQVVIQEAAPTDAEPVSEPTASAATAEEKHLNPAPFADADHEETATSTAAAATSAPAVEGNVPARVAAAQDQFGITGYTKKKITVDFFKIDLHNVFRLLGEISGRNIVVDESVRGSLTLALNEVPWDFVLDIVLNLNDLQKMERYNTIVISQKSKEFAWPEQVADKLTIRADGTAEAQDSLSIKKRIETPKEVMEAKKLIHLGHAKYQAGDFTGALGLYEEAAGKWQENGQLAKRIAALCLVRLGQNAKAVHYAKAALKTDPRDYDAALQAAIGLANMKKSNAAKEYFDLAASGQRPSSEALTSYAAFCEQNENYVETLLLLSKHTDLYGDTLETMLAKARIYDKQGNSDKAAKEYRALLLSGYNLPPDLMRYIKGRLAVADR